MENKITLAKQRVCSISIENIQFRALVANTPITVSENEETFSVSDIHNHVSAELFAVLKGKIEIITEGGNLLLNQGDLAIVPPWFPHCMICTESGSRVAEFGFICEKRIKGKTNDLYNKLLRYVAGDRVSVYRQVPDLCHNAAEILSENINCSEVLTALRTVELLLSISDRSHEVDIIQNTPKKDKYDIDIMMYLDNKIARFNTEDMSSAKIANELYISSRQLDRIIRKRYGKTLHKLITEKRVRKAERLLTTTDITAENVGREAGFTSTPGFYREFVRYYGVTPAKYRNQVRKN